MRITAVTTCVRYAEHLNRGIEVWRDTLDEWLVVTAPEDSATQALCERHGVRVRVTDAFTRHPRALFDKALAISEALAELAPRDWLLLVDADIQAPPQWRQALARCEAGALYGAGRGDRSAPFVARMKQGGELGGFFHLWHSSDPAWLADPSLGSWEHAGAYDTVFERRWPAERRVRLPVRLRHSGRAFTDWCGAGRQAVLRDRLAERRRRGGFDHERLDR